MPIIWYSGDLHYTFDKQDLAIFYFVYILYRDQKLIYSKSVN